MDLLALGAELLLELTPDGQPSLRCPVHGTQTPVETLLDQTVELVPCGCERADIAAYWAEQSPMLAEMLASNSRIGGNGSTNVPEPKNANAPQSEELDGCGAPVGESGEQVKDSGAGVKRQ